MRTIGILKWTNLGIINAEVIENFNHANDTVVFASLRSMKVSEERAWKLTLVRPLSFLNILSS